MKLLELIVVKCSADEDLFNEFNFKNEEDEDFDFEEVLREIHVELEDLNAESMQLAAAIKRNFEELGI